MDERETNAMLGKLDEIAGLLKQFLTKERESSRRLLRLKEAAHYISVSPWKLRVLVQSGEIPVLRNGEGAAGVWLVDRMDLDQWINRTKTSF
jgi:excisionase family DNA binding protein